MVTIVTKDPTGGEPAAHGNPHHHNQDTCKYQHPFLQTGNIGCHDCKRTGHAHETAQDAVSDDPTQIVQQMGGYNALAFTTQRKGNHDRAAHADAVTEADRETTGKI